MANSCTSNGKQLNHNCNQLQLQSPSAMPNEAVMHIVQWPGWRTAVPKTWHGTSFRRQQGDCTPCLDEIFEGKIVKPSLSEGQLLEDFNPVTDLKEMTG